LHHPVSGKLWLHSNSKRKSNCNMHFIDTFSLIAQVRNGARHPTNAVVTATRQSTTLHVMPKQ
jgi:hypothetical protein